MVEPGLWAEQNGVAVGDCVVALNGNLVSALKTKQYQQLIKERPLTLLLEEHPKPLGEADPQGEAYELIVPQGVELLGFTTKGMPPELLEIAAIEANSWAEQQGLLETVDVLMTVDGKDVQEFTAPKLPRAMQKRPLTLGFIRTRGPAPAGANGGAAAELPWGDEAHHHLDPNHAHVAEHQQGEMWDAVANAEDEWLGWTPSDQPPNDVWIVEIEKDSWAHWQELAVDDQLLKVNGVDVHEMTKKTMKKAMNERPLTLTWWRHGTHAHADAEQNWGAAWDDIKKEKKEKKTKRKDSDTAFEGLLEAIGLDEDSDDPELAAARKAARKSKKATVTFNEGVDDMGWATSAWPPDKVRIEAIAPYGYAEKKKLKVGDELIAVNGESIKEISKADLKLLMKERPVKMTFERKIKKKSGAS